MAELKSVRLTKPHTHQGVTYAAGSTLPLPERVAQWLVDQSAAVIVGAAAPGARLPYSPPRRCCGWQ